MSADIDATEVLHIAGDVEELAELMGVIIDAYP